MELLLHPITAENLQATKSPGAYIVHGPKGGGKTTAIKRLHKDSTIELLAPDSGTIKVDAVRDLRQRLRLKDWSGETSSIVIDQADLLSVSAQNAMLKTLEELPANISMILVAEEISRLLPTVRSRCRHIYFQLPRREQTKQWLQSQLPSTDLDALDLLPPADMAAMIDQPQALEQYKQQILKIGELFEGSVYGRLRASSALQKQLPDVMNLIAKYIDSRLRHDKENRHFWVEAASTCENAAVLLHSNVNKRYVLDMLAISGTDERPDQKGVN